MTAAGDRGGAGPAWPLVWGVLGVLALLLRATLALGARGVETVSGGLEPLQLALLLLLTIFFLVTEGYAAFQKRWVPRVVGRLADLRRPQRRLHRVLAPFYGMGLVGGTSRALLRAWAGVGAIVIAILVVRIFPEPWRGIVDLAVAAALSWGSAALLVQGIRAARDEGGLPAAGAS